MQWRPDCNILWGRRCTESRPPDHARTEIVSQRLWHEPCSIPPLIVSMPLPICLSFPFLFRQPLVLYSDSASQRGSNTPLISVCLSLLFHAFYLYSRLSFTQDASIRSLSPSSQTYYYYYYIIITFLLTKKLQIQVQTHCTTHDN